MADENSGEDTTLDPEADTTETKHNAEDGAAQDVPRVFDNRDGYQASVQDVYDPYGGADAALWLPAASGSIHLSQSIPQEDAPRIVLAWPDERAAGRVVAGWLRPHELKAWSASDEAKKATVTAVVPSAADDVRTFITTIGHSQVIPGQWDGYWYGPDDDVPDEIPPWQPTGAILPATGTTRKSKEFPGLDLVYVQTSWRPLSSAAAFTYVHSTGIMHGETWRFVTFEGTTRRVFSVAELLEQDPSTLSEKFGEVAASLARKDRPVVVLRLCQEDDD